MRQVGLYNRRSRFSTLLRLSAGGAPVCWVSFLQSLHMKPDAPGFYGNSWSIGKRIVFDLLDGRGYAQSAKRLKIVYADGEVLFPLR
jgi:hypothetical protein